MPDDGLGQFRRKLYVNPQKPAEPYIKALKTLAKIREEGGREDEWKDITRFIVPRKGMYYLTDDYDKPNQRRKQKKMIDSTPRKALRNATAGIMGGMTSKARPWIRLALRDDDLMRVDSVKQWLHDATAALLEAYQFSNFYTAIGPWYRELLAFGTAAMMSLDDSDSLLRFYTFTAGEYYLGINTKGIIDQFYRRFPMTARNIVNMFGENEVSKEILADAMATDRQYKYHTICHAIQPNDERAFGKEDNTNLPFESVYWIDQDTKQMTPQDKLLGKSGFHEFPIRAPRWDVLTTQSVYGDGPGSDELGNCMGLQTIIEDEYRARHLETDPPLRIPPNYTDKLSRLPGAEVIDPTLKSGGTGQGIQKLFDFRFDYNATHASKLDIREQIQEGFFNDLFRLLIDRPGAQPPTAYEIAQRKEEKIALLSPVLDRIHVEGLAPGVRRDFAIMTRAGAIPRPPEIIQGAEMKVEFVSTLAQAQKLIGLQPIEMYMGFVGANAELWPNILDNVDYDAAANEYANTVGVPPNIVRDKTDIETMRDEKAQQAAEQQGIEQLGAGAQIAKDTSQAEPMLEAIQGGLN